MILVFEDTGSTAANDLLKDHRNLTLFKLNEFLRELRKDKEWVLRCRQNRDQIQFSLVNRTIEVMKSLKGVYFNIMSDLSTVKTNNELIYIKPHRSKVDR